jgi:tape measure domain-containing protein
MADSKIDIIITAQDDASKALQAITQQTQRLQNSVDAMGSSNTRAGAQVEELTGSLLKSNIASMALYGALNLATDALGALFRISENAVKSAADYEQLRISFESMLGSADNARTLLKQVSDFAASTPFTLPQVAEGSRQLLAYGTAAKDVIPTFKMLGDIASGVGTDKLPFLVNAFGQVQAKGHLAGQELLQFTNAGVGLSQQIEKNLHITNATFDTMMQKGQISAQTVTEALRSMTANGGLFFNGMERQSKSFNGVLSNLSDDFVRLGNNIVGISDSGDIRQGSLFAKLTGYANELLKMIDKNRDAIERYASALLDRLVGFINTQVVPALQKFGKELLAYISSPKFQEDMKHLWTGVQNIATGFMAIVNTTGAVVGFFDTVYNRAKPVIDALKFINNFSPAGIVGNAGMFGLKKLFGYAEGTDNHPGGLAIVGERGPELVNLPQGSQVIPAQQTEALLAQRTGGASVHIENFHSYSQADITAFAERLSWRLT